MRILLIQYYQELTLITSVKSPRHFCAVVLGDNASACHLKKNKKIIHLKLQMSVVIFYDIITLK